MIRVGSSTAGCRIAEVTETKEIVRHAVNGRQFSGVWGSWSLVNAGVLHVNAFSLKGRPDDHSGKSTPVFGGGGRWSCSSSATQASMEHTASSAV
jgi:hypothetical protein